MQMPVDPGMTRAFKLEFIANDRPFDGFMVTDSVTDVNTGMAERFARGDGIARILNNIRTLTGYKVLLIQHLGARLGNDTVPDISKTMHIFPLVADFFVLWLVMGNDLYPPGRFYYHQDELIDKASGLISGVYKKQQSPYGHQMFVFGGSAETWQYRLSYEQDACNMYDKSVNYMVQGLRKRIRDKRCIVVSGAAVFQNLEMDDRIGHISRRSVDLFSQQLALCLPWKTQRSKL